MWQVEESLLHDIIQFLNINVIVEAVTCLEISITLKCSNNQVIQISELYYYINSKYLSTVFVKRIWLRFSNDIKYVLFGVHVCVCVRWHCIREIQKLLHFSFISSFIVEVVGGCWQFGLNNALLWNNAFRHVFYITSYHSVPISWYGSGPLFLEHILKLTGIF